MKIEFPHNIDNKEIKKKQQKLLPKNNEKECKLCRFHLFFNQKLLK